VEVNILEFNVVVLLVVGDVPVTMRYLW